MIEKRSAEFIRTSSFVIPSSFVIRASSFFEPLLENPHPISEQDAFDVVVVEAAFDQAPGQIAAVRMFRELGDEMGVGEFLLKRDLLLLGPLPVNELKKIEADRDALNPDQIADVPDVVDVTVEGRFVLVRTNEDGVDADDATPRADRLDLIVGNVAFDIIVLPRVGVRDDHWLRRDFDNVVETRRTDVREVDNDPELFAFANDVATEGRQSAARRPGRRKEAPIPGGVASNMGEAKRA